MLTNRQSHDRVALRLAALLVVAATACSGSAGKNGANGTNGTSCTATDNGNGSATITCPDGTSVVVANGKDGAPGTGCVLTTNGDGSRTITCAGGTSVVIPDETLDYGALTPDEIKLANLNAVLTSVVIPSDGHPVVTLKVSDRHGHGVRGLAATAAGSSNDTAVSFSFGLLELVPGAAPAGGPVALGVNGSGNDTWVSYDASDATSTSGTETAVVTATSSAGAIIDNRDGTYAFRFARNVTGGVAQAGTTYDATAIHRLVVLIGATSMPFALLNLVRDFVPATGADVTGQQEKADPAACLECHGSFRATPGAVGMPGTGKFHGGSVYDIRACVACHNDQRRFQAFGSTAQSEVDGDTAIQADGTWTGYLAKVNGEAVINLPVWIHKIHMGAKLALQGGLYAALPNLGAVTSPQDVRGCTKCHRNPLDNPVPQAGNWAAKPSRRACGACHDGVSFLNPPPAGRVLHGGGAQADDADCATCHAANDTDLAGKPQHLSVLPPDPNATLFTGGTDPNTNAAYLAAGGVVPIGASVITYFVNSVGVDANGHPKIVFKLLEDGADATFSTPPAASTPTQELIPGGKFVGSPSVYFVWAVPQDGIARPADFNVSASGYLRNINNKSAIGTITGPATVGNVTGLYTVTLTGTTITSNASMLQGGVGYSYSLAGTQPLTQVDLSDYPTAASSVNAALLTGGLLVPAPNAWKTASGCTTTPNDTTALCVPRRGITSSTPTASSVVSNAKCNACHARLGAGPTFHAGQYDESTSCAFCHRPNQASSGWSADARSFVHAVHASSVRTVPFTWHAASATSSAADITYPAALNSCEACHNAGTYDFSSTEAALALPKMLPITVATGRFDARETTNPAGYFSISPYVVDPISMYSDDYGWSFSTFNVTYTLPDGVNGTQNANACTPAAPCTCTPANPCVYTITTDTTLVEGVQATFFSVGGTGAACTAASPCTCVTNPGTGPRTTCVATLRTCSPSAPCDAADTTLVDSPMVAACASCHDAPVSIEHMRSNGGAFYEPRSVFKQRMEQCLICHGLGRMADISVVHQDTTR